MTDDGLRDATAHEVAANIARLRSAAPPSQVVPGPPDRFGLEAAFSAHGGELFGFARRSLGDTAAAEDVVQETFLRAWRARHRFDPELGTMRTWLFTILRRLIIDHVRARDIRAAEPLPADHTGGEVEDTVDAALARWQVEEAIRRLRPEHRHVLVQVHYQGRPPHEVAEELGIPDGTVRSRLFYALRSLRLILDEMGWTP